jgi:hypothetical protein
MSDRVRSLSWLSSRTAAMLLVALAGCAAYANSLPGAFVFDDVHEVLENPAVRTLWPPWVPMFGGRNLPARPLPYLSFAVDHAVWGDERTGYHLTNLVLHLAAALLIFELVFRTLTSPRLRERWAGRALGVATATAAIWVVHPLTTQAVTYIYQRIEVMAAVGMLASLCAAERAVAIDAKEGSWANVVRRRWGIAALLAAVAAMLSKETAVVLPVLVFSYAWVFRQPTSAADLWRRHTRLWLALAGTWGVLAAVLWVESRAYGELGEQRHPPLAYLVTQAGVILQYVRLAGWPVGQNLDYDWPLVRDGAAAFPQVVVVAGGVTVAVWGVLYRRAWSWPLAAFFLLLAPTSSVLPVTDVANEHRMYLPLACLVALVVAVAGAAVGRAEVAWPGRRAVIDRAAFVLTAAVVLALGIATHERNRLYHHRWLIWNDVLAKSPNNPRGNSIVACMLAEQGRTEAAIELARRAVARDPWGLAFQSISEALTAAGDHAGGERACRAGIEAIRATAAAGGQPEFDLQAGLATALVEQGKLDEAERVIRQQLPAMGQSLGGDHPITLSMTLVAVRTKLMHRDVDAAIDDARAIFERAARSLGDGHSMTLAAETTLGIALAERGDDPAAERHLRHVLAVHMARPTDDAAKRSAAALLVDFLASRGRLAEARSMKSAFGTGSPADGRSARDAGGPMPALTER